QRAEPGVLVFPDQADAPGERVTAATGHPRVDERVEHPALALAQPGHNRHGKCGEHHFPALAHHAPGNLAAEPPLRLAGDLDPRLPPPLRGHLAPPLPRLSADPPAPPPRESVRLSLPRPLFGRLLHRRKLANDRDLLPVHDHLRRPGEPPVRQPPEAPIAYLRRRVY